MFSKKNGKILAENTRENTRAVGRSGTCLTLGGGTGAAEGFAQGGLLGGSELAALRSDIEYVDGLVRFGVDENDFDIGADGG